MILRHQIRVEDNGVDTDAECRRTKAKYDGILTDRHCGGHDGQHARNNKGRVSSEKNVIQREDSNDGRNEIERYSGRRTKRRERQSVWNSFHEGTPDVNRDDDQAKHGATASHGATADHETTTPLELGNLMAMLDQIDRKLKCSEEDREVMKKELRYNKHEYLGNYFNLAKATVEKLQQMSDKVEATDKDREENINKDMQVTKQRYDAVNSQLGSLETRMDTMRRDQAESSCAIQAKLEAILRNSKSQDRPVTDRTQGNRVDFVEPQRNKRESTPLPLPRGAASIGPGGPRQLLRVGPQLRQMRSTTSNNVGPDAMTWAST